jgi:hypothetical protein
LNIERSIPAPADAKDQIIQCSFFRTWKDIGEGDTPIDRIVDGIDRAYKQKTLPLMDEIEYIALILDCRVMRVNTITNTMSCGFWTEKTSPRSRTIVLLDTDILSKVTRRKGNVGSKFVYAVDIKQFEDEAKKTLQELHISACSTSLPTFEDAQNELLSKNLLSNTSIIVSPYFLSSMIALMRDC